MDKCILIRPAYLHYYYKKVCFNFVYLHYKLLPQRVSGWFESNSSNIRTLVQIANWIVCLLQFTGLLSTKTTNQAHVQLSFIHLSSPPKRRTCWKWAECFLSPPHTSFPPFLYSLEKSNGVYCTSITPLIPLPSYTQRRGLQPVWGRRLQALMWEPGANGSTGYCKVMKGLHFYDDVNDVGRESKRACEHSTMSIYCTWLDGRGSEQIICLGI